MVCEMLNTFDVKEFLLLLAREVDDLKFVIHEHQRRGNQSYYSNGTGDNLEFVINEVFALILSHSLSYFSDILSSVFSTEILFIFSLAFLSHM